MRSLSLVILLAACGGGGEYRLAWTIAGVAPGGDARVCAGAGIDAVMSWAITRTAEVKSKATWRCRDGDGTDGLDPGDYDLHVWALAPDGTSLLGPVTASGVHVTEGATAMATVNLQPSPAAGSPAP